MSVRLSPRLFATTNENSVDGRALLHYCPGCNMRHLIPVEKRNHLGAVWSWNNDARNPTVTPSVNIDLGNGRRCHYFIRENHIEFCGDCTHSLAGQRVQLPIMDVDFD